MNWKKNCA